MQLQFHPASGSGPVRTISVGHVGERLAIGAAAALAALAVSLWFTVPAVTGRQGRQEDGARALAESRALRSQRMRVQGEADAVRRRALAGANLLNRIAFLYRVPPSQWPRILAPEHRLLSDGAPERVADQAPAYLVALEKGLDLLAQREAEDPAVSRQVPAIVPLGDAPFEPSAYFGPRKSPWTKEEEFLSGIEIAAAAGTAVVAPGDGVVTFAGSVRRGLKGGLWRLGNVVVLSHGPRGATVFGHLAKFSVRRGEKVLRGARLGTVGSSGWAISPQLHYEFWRPDGSNLRPTDPLFAVLDSTFDRPRSSLEQMDATWAPGPLSPLPGIGIRAERAAGPSTPPSRRIRRRAVGAPAPQIRTPAPQIGAPAPQIR
ncbi:MAG: M23 family metallopeptidase [Acidobacteriota bacterium]|nr:M23 family metallopeptidase [Acidobacteriota bacterium]